MKNRRSLFIINPQFQYKLATFNTILFLIPSTLYLFLIYKITEQLMHFSQKQFIGGNEQFLLERKELLILILVWHLAISIAIYISSLFIGHRIAGPIYKLKTFMQNRILGKGKDKIQFRRGDYFPEMAHIYNNFIENQSKNIESSLVEIDEILIYLNNIHLIVPEDKKVVIDEIISKLSQIKSRLGLES
jgi:hypothetical protein